MRGCVVVAIGSVLAACPRAPAPAPAAVRTAQVLDGARIVDAGDPAAAVIVDAGAPAAAVDADPGYVIGPVVADTVAAEPAPTCVAPRRLSSVIRTAVGVRFCASGGGTTSLTTGELVLARDGTARLAWTTHAPQVAHGGDSSWHDDGTSTFALCWRARGRALELDDGGGWRAATIARDAGQPQLRYAELRWHVCAS